MSLPATTFVTYLWHYVVSRLLYDDLVHPLVGGVGAPLLILVALAAAAVAALRIRRRRS
jgi:hypothetical protein